MKIIKEVSEVIDNALDISKSKEEFIELLQQVGYKVRWGGNAKTVTFTLPNGQRVRNSRIIGLTKHDCSTEGLYNHFNNKSSKEIAIESNTSNTGKKVRFFKSLQGISDYCKKNKIAEKDQRVIYVLALQNDFYYVGQTANFKKRMERHFAGNKGGSQWTELHLPVSVQEIIDMGTMEESACSIYETAKTIEYMHLYGVAHVRGGDFCSLEYKEILRLLETHGFVIDKGKPYPGAHGANGYIKAINTIKTKKLLLV